MLINFKTYSTCKDPNYDKRMKVYIFLKQLHSYDSHSVLFIYQYIYVIYDILYTKYLWISSNTRFAESKLTGLLVCIMCCLIFNSTITFEFYLIKIKTCAN